MANLRRVSDGEGEQGASSQSIKWNKDKSFKEVTGPFPTIGESMKVGSITARSYSKRDSWITTIVTEILEEIKDTKCHYIRFKTKNSEYEWWVGLYPKKINKEDNKKN